METRHLLADRPSPPAPPTPGPPPTPASPQPPPTPAAASTSSSFVEKFEKAGFLRSRMGSRRVRNRLVQKYGFVNISLANIPKQHRKYFRDIFTTVIEVKWRWCLIFFSMSFFVSWSIFTGLYYLLALYHGDFEHRDEPAWTPCISNGDSLLNLFLFAFTTQTTIGYGYRYPTDACPLTVMTMCVQFMVGVMTQTLMAGVIFAKLARPIKRAATILFSKNAVICMRDGKLCLLFRVGDMRKSSLAEAHVRLQMIKKCVTLEGEVLPFHQFDLNVGYDTGLDRVFVIWPITICHEIDESSPLYEMSKKGLEKAHFEVIAILEGVVESVGSTTQARTSYLPNEILWGKRFEKLVTYQRENGEYKIDFGKFHNVYDVDMPECSAKELDEMRSQHGSVNGFLMKKYSSDSTAGAGPMPATAMTTAMTLAQSVPRPIDRTHVPTVSLPDVLRLHRATEQGILIEPTASTEEEADDEGGLQLNGGLPPLQMRRRRSFLVVPGDGALMMPSESQRKQSFQVRRGPDLF